MLEPLSTGKELLDRGIEHGDECVNVGFRVDQDLDETLVLLDLLHELVDVEFAVEV
ncbi:hypothetical protein [Streptomyces sp. NPDC058066]|uniref:hypothetical protein n=1 Tax=Streptomyces sp. NPDC058066 TaxID=3346323 RepID=UPI0036E3B21D